ncbi:arylsulfatase [Draconibacterium sp. IB214405]|uniref:sulfatase family protein n=1 Tax=Draconibacterium sp. IB214405 TaxID=3097352 RepID=UPI002A17DB53|nr:arylsulfatase [Draconibacterium sp. IB214405]MDX8339030.1 arylsulfatase [Draconibacterium sp. IB214405]
MKSYRTILSFLILSVLFTSCNSKEEKSSVDSARPNIVIIYLDDLGYGDVSAYGATEINTPNIDRLANEGVMFTDGHASSATCTPSRYALLTGVYPWRNKDAKILPGTAPLIIDTAQITMPKMLKEQGYYTGVVGKWHLGLGSGHVNWNEHVSPGPNEIGFDYSYIMAATQDRVPTVYLENGLVEGLDPNDPIEIDYQKNFEGEPTGLDNPELTTMKWEHGHNNSIVNGIPRIGFMKGGEKAKWSDVDMADHFLAKAQSYVKQHKKEPFFLYYALQQPHVPRTPNPRFVGKTDLGPRGDVIVEADWCIGEFIKTLEEEGILENTMIILSSDNGPVLNDGYYDAAVERIGNHDQNGGLRGGKYSLFEAGTRVPFISYWKGKIEPKKSDALVCQLDILTSVAKLTGAAAGTSDSEELLDVLMGKSDSGRDELVLEASSRTAYRKGSWLMIPPYQGPAIIASVNIEIGNASEYQLYNLNDDIGQQKNLASSNTDKLDEMITDYKEIIGSQSSKVEALELK